MITLLQDFLNEKQTDKKTKGCSFTIMKTTRNNPMKKTSFDNEEPLRLIIRSKKFV